MLKHENDIILNQDMWNIWWIYPRIMWFIELMLIASILSTITFIDYRHCLLIEVNVLLLGVI